jgi:hypothetical protein
MTALERPRWKADGAQLQPLRSVSVRALDPTGLDALGPALGNEIVAEL